MQFNRFRSTERQSRGIERVVSADVSIVPEQNVILEMSLFSQQIDIVHRSAVSQEVAQFLRSTGHFTWLHTHTHTHTCVIEHSNRLHAETYQQIDDIVSLLTGIRDDRTQSIFKDETVSKNLEIKFKQESSDRLTSILRQHLLSLYLLLFSTKTWSLYVICFTMQSLNSSLDFHSSESEALTT